MEVEPREVYTRKVDKPVTGVVKDVIICDEGLISQGTVEYEKDDGTKDMITVVSNSQSDFKEGEEIKLIPS